MILGAPKLFEVFVLKEEEKKYDLSLASDRLREEFYGELEKNGAVPNNLKKEVLKKLLNKNMVGEPEHLADDSLTEKELNSLIRYGNKNSKFYGYLIAWRAVPDPFIGRDSSSYKEKFDYKIVDDISTLEKALKEYPPTGLEISNSDSNGYILEIPIKNKSKYAKHFVYKVVLFDSGGAPNKTIEHKFHQIGIKNIDNSKINFGRAAYGDEIDGFKEFALIPLDFSKSGDSNYNQETGEYELHIGPVHPEPTGPSKSHGSMWSKIKK
jgi:hypothetical protein